MLIRTFVILLVFLFFIKGADSLEVEGVEVSGTSYIDVVSHYMWRGQQLSDKWVIQPTVEITYGGFGFNYWANYDLHTAEVSETDYTLFYNYSIGKFNMEVGSIYYAFDSADDTFELFISGGFDVFLNPTITAYFDVDEGSGTWIAAEVGHTFKVYNNIDLNVGALVSYNIHHDLVGVDENGEPFSDFSNAEFSLSLSIPIWKSISIEPHAAYTFALSGDARDGFKAASIDPGDETDRKFYGGVALNISF